MFFYIRGFNPLHPGLLLILACCCNDANQSLDHAEGEITIYLKENFRICVQVKIMLHYQLRLLILF